MKQYRVAVIGATGMVGQRFVSLLENHPWFTVTALAASSHSAGKTYEQAVGSRWMMSTPIPKSVAGLVVQDAVADAQQIAHSVDFAFCAVDMKKEEIRALEETYAKYECPVMSNNSAHRFTPDVPMIIPELNDEHAQVIEAQRKRLAPAAALLPSNPTALCRAMFLPCTHCAPLASPKHLPAPIRRFRARAKTLRHGRRWWTMSSPLSAVRKKKVRKSR